MRDGVVLANLIISHIPYLSDKFIGFQMIPATKEQKFENAKILIDSLEFIYGFSPFDAKMLLNGSQLDMLLFFFFLYQTLPSFAPRGVIEFSAPLHQIVSKTIEINNHTSRTIVYIIDVSGSAEFSVSEKQITVLPKSHYNLQVEFKSRFNYEINSVLTLKSKKMGFNLTSILVYNLTGNVESTPPKEIFDMKAPMYCNPPVLQKIVVENPFNEDCVFLIKLIAKKAMNDFDDENLQPEDMFNPVPFQVSEKELSIKAGGAAEISIRFIPFDAGCHVCLIHFLDPKVGEFTYKIEGLAVEPQPVETIVWNIEHEGSTKKSLIVNQRNFLRDKAIFAALSPFVQPHIISVPQKKTGKVFKSATILEREQYQFAKNKPLRYKVETSSGVLRCNHSEIIMQPNSETNKNDPIAMERNSITIPFIFTPKVIIYVIRGTWKTYNQGYFDMHGCIGCESLYGALCFQM